MYNSKEVAEILGVSDKSVRRYLNSYFSLENGSYQVSEKMLEVLKNEYLDEQSDIIVQPYTRDEYEELHKRLSEYPFLKERVKQMLDDLEYHKAQVEYHKTSSDKHLAQIDTLINAIHQRNFIEAKEKGFDEK